MNIKLFLALSLALIAIIIACLLFAYHSPTTLSPRNLEECSTLTYSSESSVNFVFLTDKPTAKKYSDFLLTISPFKENKDKFNFYYIPAYNPECELYKDIALLCYSSEVIKKASSCPSDIIVAIQDQPSNIRSSSYMQVISLNSKNPITVLPHEIGHSLSNLAEEYTPAKIPAKSKNCQKSCSFPISDGCFLGCSEETYQRSIDNGIMRTLSSSTFGKYDEFLILESIKNKQTKITGQVSQQPTNCEQEKYYLIQGVYNSSSIEFKEKSIEYGCPGTNGNGDFSYKLILEDNSQYFSPFNPELIFTDSQQENQETIEGQVFTSEKEFVLKVPTIKESKSLEIYNAEDQKLAELNLQDLKNTPCKIS